ncbi:adenylate/guanylate cyclase domain-containing protein [Minwuia thermotolerans]|nr:adenylate/guanylate cyclase domain-containing protein [Minwuia thermotolerans]
MINRVRLYSGLVLFAFLATHLVNHALGIVSLQAMDGGREIFLFVWRSWAGTAVLLTATMAHVATGLASIYRRRTWRGITAAEVVQYITALAIPPLLVLHILANRGLHELHGLEDTYSWVLMGLWQLDPFEGLKQAALTIIAWIHGCLGVHMWLRLKPRYRPCAPALYTAALMVLVLGLAGFVSGGQEVSLRAQDPVWLQAYTQRTALPAEAAAWVYETRDATWTAMIAFIGLLGAARGAHYLWERRRNLVTIRYPDNRRAIVEPGVTVLEASRRAGIAHASVCGGRGRCSTCRIRVLEGWEKLPPPEDAERRVLRRIGAPEGVRLACQLRPEADLRVIPLVAEPAEVRDAYGRNGYAQGAERRIAILFADLRDFTRFAEGRLPYDVVFVINQYCRYMGRAVEANGGRLDKFIGDGVMALFGIESGPEDGARRALAAARDISVALDRMNQALADDLGQPMRIGIGVHVGDVIVGEMGYRDTVSLTAIGDAVNTASRLEAANKEFGSQLVLSAETAATAGLDMSGRTRRQVAIPGRDRTVDAFVLNSAADLPESGGGTKS